jgi:hypothetical protein
MIAASHRFGVAIFAAVVAISGTLSAPAFAQSQPGTHQDNSGLNGSLSNEDLQKLGGNKQPDSDTNLSRDVAQARAKAKTESEELVKGLGLSCHITDAQLVVAGTRKPASGGKEMDTRVYEVACDGAMGYLLETQGTDKSIGISCLAAEETRAIDVAKGKPPGFFCKLPENKDVFATVTSMITAATGAACAVRDLQAFGHSESTKSDYSEVACQDGKGFLLRVPLPGSQAQTLIMSCADAARQGIKCRLTDAGPVQTPMSMETFKGALAQNGVTCKIDQIRFIGQEDNRKRYVVEYRCADQATAMVAFIPLQGNANPYESIDCAAALLRGAVCKFTTSN